MFKIKENGHDPIISNDTKDIYDIIIGISGDENEAKKAHTIVCYMQWGDVYKTSSYSIECYDETNEEESKNKGGNKTIFNENETKTMIENGTFIKVRDFYHLQIGDKVYIRVKGRGMIETKVTRQAFWNSDADEPCWEIETDNGFATEGCVWEIVLGSK